MKEGINDLQIASSLMTVMGLAVPFANTGDHIFDLYSDLNEGKFIYDAFINSYNNLKQI